MGRSPVAVARMLVLGSIAISWTHIPCLHAADPANSDLERRFAQTVRPFLATYCVACHGGASPAAQFDLRPFTTLAAVVRDYPPWNLVLEKLSANQMPPQPVKQPPAQARQEVIAWVQAMRMSEARKNSGDP